VTPPQWHNQYDRVRAGEWRCDECGSINENLRCWQCGYDEDGQAPEPDEEDEDDG
jgi:hypothetical protein